jgi:hypothetical protein
MIVFQCNGNTDIKVRECNAKKKMAKNANFHFFPGSSHLRLPSQAINMRKKISRYLNENHECDPNQGNEISSKNLLFSVFVVVVAIKLLKNEE